MLVYKGHEQPISPIVFLFLKLPPPPRAVLLVYRGHGHEHNSNLCLLDESNSPFPSIPKMAFSGIFRGWKMFNSSRL